MHQSKLAILGFVHAAMQQLPLVEQQFCLPTGFAPVVSGGFAWAGEGEGGFAPGVEGQHACHHLYSKTWVGVEAPSVCTGLLEKVLGS